MLWQFELKKSLFYAKIIFAKLEQSIRTIKENNKELSS